MKFKKVFLTTFLFVFVSAFGFSQAGNLAVMGNYNPLNPSFWSAGFMFGATMDYSRESAHFARIGMTVGQLTLSYEKENPFTSKHEMTEFWQRSSYIDWIFGYVYQKEFKKDLAMRFGGDFYMAFSTAYINSDFNSEMPFNVGLTGIVGLNLFPKGKYFISLDACPGFTLNPVKRDLDVFAFIVPIRLCVGTNWGPDIKK